MPAQLFVPSKSLLQSYDWYHLLQTYNGQIPNGTADEYWDEYIDQGLNETRTRITNMAAYIQTNDLKRAHTISERLYSGGVYINGGTQIMPHTPFGGIGISGFGKEGGRAGIDAFLRYKTVTIAG